MSTKLATRATFREFTQTPDVVFVPDATPVGGLYLKRLTVAEVEAARNAAKQTDADGEVTVHAGQMQENLLAACLLNSGDPADRMYGLAEGPAVRAELLPGDFDRLYIVQNALLGYRNSESARLDFYRTGQTSDAGSSTAPAGSPPSAPKSTPAAPSTSGATTA